MIAVHCKAGKGRTGLVISSLLLHLDHPSTHLAPAAAGVAASAGTASVRPFTVPAIVNPATAGAAPGSASKSGPMVLAPDAAAQRLAAARAEAALAFFGKQRTSNGKGVTIPSQQRWVHMYAHWIQLRQASLRQRDLTGTADAVAAAAGATPSGGIAAMRTDPCPLPEPTVYFLGYDLYPRADLDPGGGCDPYVIIK